MERTTVNMSVSEVLETVNAEQREAFVEFSYSSKDAFERFEDLKRAQAIIRESLIKTNGHMPKFVVEEYEALNDHIEKLKGMNLNIIGSGR